MPHQHVLASADFPIMRAMSTRLNKLFSDVRHLSYLLIFLIRSYAYSQFTQLTTSPHSQHHPIGVGNGFRRPRPPNRACGSPAHGSPVGGFLIGIGSPASRL